MKNYKVYLWIIIALIFVDFIYVGLYIHNHKDFVETNAILSYKDFIKSYVNDDGEKEDVYDYYYDYYVGDKSYSLKFRSDYGEEINIIYDPINPENSEFVLDSITVYTLAINFFLVFFILVMCYVLLVYNQALENKRTFSILTWCAGCFASIHKLMIDYIIERFFNVKLITTQELIISAIFFIIFFILLVFFVNKYKYDDEYLEEKNKNKMLERFEKAPYYDDSLGMLLISPVFIFLYIGMFIGFVIGDENNDIIKIIFWIAFELTISTLTYFSISNYIFQKIFKRNLRNAILNGDMYDGEIICYSLDYMEKSGGDVSYSYYLVVKYFDGIEEKIIITPRLSQNPNKVLGGAFCKVYKYKNEEYVWNFELNDGISIFELDKDNSYLKLLKHRSIIYEIILSIITLLLLCGFYFLVYIK